MLISYTKLTLFLFIFLIGISKSYNNHRVESSEYLMKSDLVVLLKSLDKLIGFTSVNNVEPNLNYVFGIFLINVNLERVLVIEKHDLDFQLRRHLTQLLVTNNRNLHILTKGLLMHSKRQDIQIFTGMNPITSIWANRLSKLKMSSYKNRKRNTKNEIRLSWLDYKAKIANDELGVPTPKISDKCLASFSQSPIQYSGESRQCKVDKICRYIIRNGTNVGYALTHRLLPLLIARFGRGCYIFSPEEDFLLTKEFCGNIYEEAVKIVRNNFFNMDLLMEQIALCSLNGHATFFHRSWFLEMLQYQNIWGCFSKNNTSSRRQKIEDITGCGEHTTSVAGGALSAAVRFVIDFFY